LSTTRNTATIISPASDMSIWALVGVPAHTFSVTYEFPDYHGVGDEWYKIDYENMAKVDRMLAAGVLDLAGRPKTTQMETRPIRKNGAICEGLEGNLEGR